MKTNKHSFKKKILIKWWGLFFLAICFLLACAVYSFLPDKKIQLPLSNLHYNEDKQAKSIQLTFYYPAGFYNESEISPGIAHLLEHLFFSQDEKFLELYFKKGATFYAETRGYLTFYYFDIPPSLLKSTLRQIEKFLSHPQFRLEDIKREITVIAEEESILNNPIWLFLDAIKKNTNKDHPFFTTYPSYSYRPSEELKAINHNTIQKHLFHFHSQYASRKAEIIIQANEKDLNLAKKMIGIRDAKMLDGFKQTAMIERPPIFKEGADGFIYLPSEVNKLFFIYPLNNICPTDFKLADKAISLFINLNSFNGLKERLIHEGLAANVETFSQAIDAKQHLLIFDFTLTELGMDNVAFIKKMTTSFLQSVAQLEIKKDIIKLLQENTKEEDDDYADLISDNILNLLNFCPSNASFDENTVEYNINDVLNKIAKTKFLTILYGKKPSKKPKTILNYNKINQSYNFLALFKEIDNIQKNQEDKRIGTLKPLQTPSLIEEKETYEFWHKHENHYPDHFKISLLLNPTTNTSNFLIKNVLLLEFLNQKLSLLKDVSFLKNRDFVLTLHRSGAVNIQLLTTAKDFRQDLEQLIGALKSSLSEKTFFNLKQIASSKIAEQRATYLLDSDNVALIKDMLNKKSLFNLAQLNFSSYSFQDWGSPLAFDKITVFVHGDCSEDTLQLINAKFKELRQQPPIHNFHQKESLQQNNFKRINFIEKKSTDPSFLLFNYSLSQGTPKTRALLYLTRLYIKEELYKFFREDLSNPIYEFEMISINDGIQLLIKNSNYTLEEIYHLLTSFFERKEKEINYLLFKSLKQNYISSSTWLEEADFNRIHEEYWSLITSSNLPLNNRQQIKEAAKNLSYDDFKKFFKTHMFSKDNISILTNKESDIDIF